MLLEKQTEKVQATLWVALRLFEERKKLLSGISGTGKGTYHKKLEDIETHIAQLKQLLTDLQKITNSTLKVSVVL